MVTGQEREAGAFVGGKGSTEARQLGCRALEQLRDLEALGTMKGQPPEAGASRVPLAQGVQHGPLPRSQQETHKPPESA